MLTTRRVSTFVFFLATLSCLVFEPQPAMAGSSCTGPFASPTTAVGDVICNPDTGATETVTLLVNGDGGTGVPFVETNQGNVFLTVTTVGATFEPMPTPNNPPMTYTVESVTKNSSGEVISVSLQPSTSGAAAVTWSVVTAANGQGDGGNGSGGNQPSATGTGPGQVNLVERGANGHNGSDAYCLVRSVRCLRRSSWQWRRQWAAAGSESLFRSGEFHDANQSSGCAGDPGRISRR